MVDAKRAQAIVSGQYWVTAQMCLVSSDAGVRPELMQVAIKAVQFMILFVFEYGLGMFRLFFI
jgi:hypothetical protein